jgi:hypothetical protein
MSDERNVITIGSADELLRPNTRRSFLRVAALGGTAVFLPGVFAACRSDDVTGPGNGGAGADVRLDLNTDVGIFNYAYALEQLEAAFYTAVVTSANFTTLLPDAIEREIMTDLRNHEVIHREFFKAALGTAAIGSLALTQSAVNSALANRASILRTAQTLEDLGVAAYNGAGKQLKDARNLLVAGKIVSVEARHAAAIRDLRDSGGTAFADSTVVTSDTGLDVKLEPSAVLTRVAASGLVSTTIAIRTQPSTAATPDFGPPNPTP